MLDVAVRRPGSHIFPVHLEQVLIVRGYMNYKSGRLGSDLDFFLEQKNTLIPERGVGARDPGSFPDVGEFFSANRVQVKSTQDRNQADKCEPPGCLNRALPKESLEFSGIRRFKRFGFGHYLASVSFLGSPCVEFSQSSIVTLGDLESARLQSCFHADLHSLASMLESLCAESR